MKEEIEQLINRLKESMYRLNNSQADLRKVGNDLGANYQSGRFDATGSIICDLVNILNKQ